LVGVFFFVPLMGQVEKILDKLDGEPLKVMMAWWHVR
jgi:hypothetical protein